jgi:hypothetical protein
VLWFLLLPYLILSRIPFDRALDFANREKITEQLYPLFVHDIGALLYHPSNQPQPGLGNSNALAAVDRRRSHAWYTDFPTSRPSLDRANTFPTPPTSASSNLGVSSHGNAYEWQGSQPLSIDTGSIRSIPTTPASTPPSQAGQGYDEYRQIYTATPPQESIHPSQLRQSGGPLQDSIFPKSELAPPLRTSEDEQLNDVKPAHEGITQSVQSLTDVKHEYKSKHTHTSTPYNPNRVSYSYNRNPNALERVPEDLMALPQQNGSGRATPKTTEWHAGYGAQGNKARASNVYRVMEPRAAIGDSYAYPSTYVPSSKHGAYPSSMRQFGGPLPSSTPPKADICPPLRAGETEHMDVMRAVDNSDLRTHIDAYVNCYVPYIKLSRDDKVNSAVHHEDPESEHADMSSWDPLSDAKNIPPNVSSDSPEPKIKSNSESEETPKVTLSSIRSVSIPTSPDTMSEVSTMLDSSEDTEDGSADGSSPLVSLQDHKQALLERLMRYFFAWFNPRTAYYVRGQEATGGTGSGSFNLANDPKSGSSSQARPAVSGSKRSHDEMDEEGNDGHEEENGKIKLIKLDEEFKGLKFACPYYKRNPAKYQSWIACPGPGWGTVHRVKYATLFPACAIERFHFLTVTV